MNIRSSRFATSVLVIAAVVLTAGRSGAVFHMLPPSKDEHGLKYDVAISAADGDTLNVVFTLADEGRLKPIHSATVVSFSKPDRSGGRTYDVKEKIEFQTTPDGRRAGQVQIPKEFVDRAMIRILTLSVDGRRQTAGAAYYDIPLQKFLNKAQTPPSLATPPTPKVVK